MVYTEGDKNIGNYDSPEALAKALDTKNQELAKKIRTFGESQILLESQDWREALRKELSQEDERQIRDAFGETQIDVFFNEGMTAEEKAHTKAQQALESVLPGNASEIRKIGTIQKIWKNLTKGWDKAMALFHEGKWMEAFSALFTMGKDKEVENENNHPETNSDHQKDIEISKNIGYQAALKVILGFTPEKDEKTFDLLNMPQISGQKFANLKNLKEETIMSDLGITGNNITGKDVYGATQVLIKKESQIDELLGKQYPNWRTQYSIIELCTILGPTMKPIEAFQKINYKDIGNSQISFGEFKIGEPSDLSEKFEELKKQRGSIFEGVSPELMSQILLSKNTDQSYKETLLNSYKHPKDQKFIEAFDTFHTDMLEGIKADFFLGKEDARNKFNDYFTTLTPKQNLELMLLTGGKTNKSEMNSFEQTSVFLKLWSVMGISELRGQTYDYAFLQGSLKEGSEFSEKIPQPLKDTIKTIAKNSLESSISVLGKTIKELFGMLSTEQKIGVGIASGVVLAGLWYMGPLRHALGGVVVMGLGGGLAMIASQAYANDPTKFKEKFGNISPEEIANQSEKEIASAFKM